MGLPLFVVPVEAEAVPKSIDDIVARARSTIRRQRIIRRRGPQTPDEEFLREIEGALGDSSYLTENRERDAATVRARIAERRRLLSGTDLAVAQGGWGDFGRREVIDGPVRGPSSPPVVTSGAPRMPPPVPESGDFQSNRTGSHPLAGRMARRTGQPGPLESLRDPLTRRIDGAGNHPLAGRMARRSRPFPRPFIGQQRSARYSLPAGAASSEQTPSSHSQPLPSLTPNFSPARQYNVEDPWAREIDSTIFGETTSNEGYWRENPTSRTRRVRTMPLSSSREGGDPSTRDLPPLRRMSSRSFWEDFESRQRRLRQARLDGLGDRDRSLSPRLSPDGDGTWETLLTTIPPDPQAPSAGSSFASASAIASTSSIGSNATPTTRTTPDSSDVMEAVSDAACDVVDNCSDDASDTEDDDDEYWETYVEQRDLRRSEVDRMIQNQRDRETHPRMDAQAQEDDTLGGMQEIVRRLAAREDIPDEWWAEVGLSRNLPRVATISGLS